MKGHGHYWQVKSVDDKERKFTAIGMAGDKPLDAKEATFVLDPKCQQWQGGKRVEQAALQPGDKRYLTWCSRDDQRVVRQPAAIVQCVQCRCQQIFAIGRIKKGEGERPARARPDGA